MKKKNYIVSCNFEEEGDLLQQIIEHYFLVYMKEKNYTIGDSR